MNGSDITMNALVSDVTEMIGFHAVNIYPELSGFAGYDCIDLDISSLHIAHSLAAI